MKKRVFVICTVVVILLLLFLRIIVCRLYPEKYSDLIEKYSKEYEVDSKLVYAIIKQESNFQNDACSSKGARGLMQLMEGTANEIAEKLEYTDIDLNNPETNIKLGIKHLADLINKYNSNEMAIVAYNAGIGNVDSWIDKGIINKDGTNLEKVPYRETNMYLRKVLQNYEIYCMLY